MILYIVICFALQRIFLLILSFLQFYIILHPHFDFLFFQSLLLYFETSLPPLYFFSLHILIHKVVHFLSVLICKLKKVFYILWYIFSNCNFLFFLITIYLQYFILNSRKIQYVGICFFIFSYAQFSKPFHIIIIIINYIVIKQCFCRI